MNLTQIIRTHLKYNHGWRKFRRLQHEGPLKALRRWRLWSQILTTPPVLTEDVRVGAPVEVHILCYERDYLSAIWSLKSFYHFAQVRYPLVIHLQGRTTRLMIGRMRRHFPSARVVTQAEADPLVEDWLARRGLVRLIEARRLSPFMLKLTDFRVLGGGANLLTLDSDIIFFRRPSELLVADDGPLPVSLFQRDPASTYNLSEERARNELGVDLAPQINTGITLFPPESLDLTRCESYLAHPEVARITGWMEQTLHALCASDQGRVAYLPDSYLISLERHADPTSLVARHYAGPSRSLLTEEGMTELTAIGFFSEIGAGRNLETLSAQPSGESC